MSAFAKIVLLAGLVQLSIAVCDAGTSSCPDVQDETSLLQVGNIVRTGSERQPHHEDEDIHQDARMVAAAFHNHAEKAEDRIEAAAAPGREFIVGEVDERRTARTQAAESFEDEKEALHESLEPLKASVAAAAKAHRNAVHEAIDRVADEKEDWLETVHDKHLAAGAAVAGRIHGINNGIEHVHEANVAAWKREVAEDHRDQKEVMALRHKIHVHNAEDVVEAHTQAIQASAADAEDHWFDERKHAEEANNDLVRHIEGHIVRSTDYMEHQAGDMEKKYAAAGQANEAAITAIVGQDPQAVSETSFDQGIASEVAREMQGREE